MGSELGRRTTTKELQLRRLAVQLAGQLPANVDDARAVIRLMKELTDTFLAGPAPRAHPFSVLDGGNGGKDR